MEDRRGFGGIRSLERMGERFLEFRGQRQCITLLGERVDKRRRAVRD